MKQSPGVTRSCCALLDSVVVPHWFFCLLMAALFFLVTSQLHSLFYINDLSNKVDKLAEGQARAEEQAKHVGCCGFIHARPPSVAAPDNPIIGENSLETLTFPLCPACLELARNLVERKGAGK